MQFQPVECLSPPREQNCKHSIVQVKNLGAHVLVDTNNEADRQKYTGENGFDVSSGPPPPHHQPCPSLLAVLFQKGRRMYDAQTSQFLHGSSACATQLAALKLHHNLQAHKVVLVYSCFKVPSNGYHA